MFLGLSLTTWVLILGFFAIITPIVGKQIAKDSLKFRDLSESRYHYVQFLILFPVESSFTNGVFAATAPVKKLTEEKYIRRMMLGGVWLKLLYNFAMMTIVFLSTVIGLVIYPFFALFRGIFSTK